LSLGNQTGILRRTIFSLLHRTIYPGGVHSNLLFLVLFKETCFTGELSDDELSYKSFGVQVNTPYSFFPPQALSVLNIDEAQSLCRLAQGQGVSREEGSSLLSPCKACGNLFLKRLVANHSLTCMRIS
jgi:hypothetical protein